jgi:hypothetical protein
MCRNGRTKTLHLIVQTSPYQQFTFTNNSVVRNVVGASIELCVLSGVTSTGTYLQLNSNVLANLQENNTSTAANLQQSQIAWFQAYPLPTLSNQLSPIEFEFFNEKTIDNFQLSLQGDGALTFGGGWYAIWRLVFFHPMIPKPDTVLAALAPPPNPNLDPLAHELNPEECWMNGAGQRVCGTKRKNRL